MLIKVKTKIYEISLKGWKDNQWSVDLADEMLVDMWWKNHQKDSFREGYTLSQKEFDEFREWAAKDVKKYNNGESLEWFERSEEYPENDYEEIKIDVEFQYVDED